MPSYKFKIGDVVNLKPSISRNVPGGTYQVTKRLPENRGEFEYCIKNLDEPYARIVCIQSASLQAISPKVRYVRDIQAYAFVNSLSRTTRA